MRYYANNIEWELEQLPDGWIAIYMIDNGTKLPRIQAKDMEHAKSYCNMYERVNVPFNAIDDESQGYSNVLCLFGGVKKWIY